MAQTEIHILTAHWNWEWDHKAREVEKLRLHQIHGLPRTLNRQQKAESRQVSHSLGACSGHFQRRALIHSSFKTGNESCCGVGLRGTRLASYRDWQPADRLPVILILFPEMSSEIQDPGLWVILTKILHCQLSEVQHLLEVWSWKGVRAPLKGLGEMDKFSFNFSPCYSTHVNY